MEYLGTFFEMGKTILAPLLSLKENEDILDKKIGELSCREIDVRADLEKANLQSGKRPKREVELWLKNVQNIKDEVLYIKQKLGELRWHHFRLQLNLAKLIKEKIEDVVQLKENGRFQEGLVVDLLPGSIQTFPTTKLVGETTALRSLKMIEECLMDDGVGKIGVYGIRGVGKTTIMTHIHNKSTMAATFNSVIWVTVSKDSCIEKLQDDVSKAMGVSLSYNKDALHRSAELIQAFIHRGRFLLILDDMWNVFPLTKVGIPEPNVENKCKIVWTTRSQTVCRGMDSQVTIKVDRLTNDESWTLFEEKLGGNLVLSTEIEQIAKAVVEECDGLPTEIITVGAAMRGVDEITIWRNALEDLKNLRLKLGGIEDDVFSCSRFCFDDLKTRRHRDCFLYCALCPEDDQMDGDSLQMLPLSINNIPPSLKQIKGSITLWDSLQWNSNNTKMLFQPFFPSAPDRDLQRVNAEENVVDDTNDADDEKRGFKRKADVLAERRHLDLNLPPLSMEQEIELSPRNSKKWKAHE
ncbi:hypothetical protein MRB53_014279 [Persea americana]|uniref:Uncharacterized protein n=1 Tax=Persea americana TaxID=3435 RepID=A0ACC2KAL9_PERAE|nr:hypothetical protein MRB53_014279 [Persea americana]|eukprot:TRINITY_DN5441_c0_g1_i1.p1 TRINITY_DN5441_c0_g1~~TRINITY_DN5441_c0_g1_i1.p1  ORF type:complete len:523 (+),score=101.53 TRINITY_DN5441_c0_g1_i1:662-2230(+)